MPPQASDYFLDPPDKIRVLLVDDDPFVVKGLARNLGMIDPRLDILHASSVTEALRCLSRNAIDALLTDLYMPGIDGTALLEEVRQRFPRIRRLVLSGEANQLVMTKASALAHHYLAKPCEAEHIHALILEALAPQASLQASSIIATLCHLAELPARLPHLAEALRQLSVPHARTALDGVLSKLSQTQREHLLHAVNTPLFHPPHPIDTLHEACHFFSPHIVLALAVTRCVLDAAPPRHESRLQVEYLWGHCVRVAAFARRLALAHKAPAALCDQVCCLGLLHDLGKLVLAHASPLGFANALARSESDRTPLWQAEYAIFYNHDAEAGGSLLRLWKLPGDWHRPIGAHHTPHHVTETSLGPVTLLHLADHLAHFSDAKEPNSLLDHARLQGLHLPENIAHWKDLVDL